MRNLFRVTLAAIVLSSFAPATFAADAAKPDAPVVASKPAPPIFADKHLEAAIRQILRKKTDSEVVKEDDLKNVYFLEAPGKQIANLAGLEKCTNLALIRMNDNAIVDVGPLAGLKNVQSLDLANNKIADVGPLAKLEK